MTTVSSMTELPAVEPLVPPEGGWELMYGGGAHPPVNGRRIDVESAIDGTVVASIPDADQDDLEAAFESAPSAAAEWGAKNPAERAPLLDAFADRIIAAVDRLGWLDTINAGMPLTATRAEAAFGASYIRDAARQAFEIKGATFAELGGVWGYTIREPYGIVGNILPFNHPVLTAAVGIGAALAAGNAVVLKPSEYSSLSAIEMGRIAQDVLPPGLVSVLTGEGARVGAAISGHPAIPRLTFTGSVATGRHVLKAAAEHIKHVTLELGGKGPLAILPDVELPRAVEMAVGGMNFRGVQAGQSCQSSSRVLVHESMYDQFCAAVVEAVGRIRVGDPRDPQTEMGALAFRRHLERVLGYIEIGKADGARLIAGGSQPAGLEGGFFVEPTVFADVDRRMRIANEEIFGPVMSIMKWSTEEELLEIANGVEYGLTARIASGDTGAAMRLATKIEAGRMWINVANGGPIYMPFGGYKLSGVGKVGDLESLISYTREKSIAAAL